MTSRHNGYNLRLRFGLYLHVSLFYLCVSFYPNGAFGSAHLTHVNRLYAIICANAMKGSNPYLVNQSDILLAMRVMSIHGEPIECYISLKLIESLLRIISINLFIILKEKSFHVIEPIVEIIALD